MSDGTLDRRAAAAALLRDPGGLLVVAGLGSAAYDAAAAGDRDENFYLWGAMGGAAMIGLGLAIAQPSRRVLVLTGDGEMLMGIGSLATIATRQPANLAIAVLDNARFGETGAQLSHTGYRTELAEVATACGWTRTAIAQTMPEVEALRPRLRAEPLFAVIKIAHAAVPRVLPPRDGGWLAGRFRRALGIAES